MATLSITEFARQGQDERGEITGGILEQPALAIQALTISGTAAASNAFNAKTTVVQLLSDAACCVLFAANPTATTSHTRLSANELREYAVPLGSSLKVSAITL